jgi:DNA-binding LacI/PurR family transcriptional regulator
MVAKRAGVSVSTASLAFSGAGPILPSTRDKVMAAAAVLGYHGPNPLGRQLRVGRSGIVGVITGGNPGRAFRDPVAIQVLDGLADALTAKQLGVLLISGELPAPGQPQTLDPLIETAAMDAAVMLWGVLADDANLEALIRRGVPVVIGDGHPVPGAPLVGVDDRAGAKAAGEHLASLGHTRIAEIVLAIDEPRRSGPIDEAALLGAARFVTRERAIGLREAIKPVMSWESPASLVEHGHAAAMAILGDWVPACERPTAIFAQSDQLAAGALLAARELGLDVPRDLSIVGFDGLDLPWLTPDRLTSVHQPLRAKGAALGQAVIGMLGGTHPQAVCLATELVPGTTSAEPPILR